MAAGNGRKLPTAGENPGGRARAPGSLYLVQALVNTFSGHTLEDLLATPAAASGWLAAAGLLPAGSPLSGGERQALIGTREAIRGVLSAHTQRAADASAAARLTEALLPCRLTVAADPAGAVHLTCADEHPYARVVGAIAVAIAEAAMAGTWHRLKACPGDRCGWAFYDRSSGGRSRWCSMQVCGARTKMRAYRSRQGGR
ncbi:MAG TPA: CGNR zinc finger domain-containing protein [Streptosporangiaceae bacterium]|jgi:predicted RNA-binding Zn ribbon-like protein